LVWTSACRISYNNIILFQTKQIHYFSRRHTTDIIRAYYIKIYYIRFLYRKAMSHTMIKFFDIIIYTIQYFILHNRFRCKNTMRSTQVFRNVYAYRYYYNIMYITIYYYYLKIIRLSSANRQ